MEKREQAKRRAVKRILAKGNSKEDRKRLAQVDSPNEIKIDIFLKMLDSQNGIDIDKRL